MTKRFIFLICLLGEGILAFSQMGKGLPTAFVLEEVTDRISLTSYLELWEDPEGKATFEDVIHQKQTASLRPWPNATTP